MKSKFSRRLPWQPPWISDQNDFTIFYLQVTTMLPTKFQVNWPFRFRRRSKMAAVVAILYFWLEQVLPFLIYKSLGCFLPSFKPIGLLVQEKKWKIDFQDCGHSSQFGFLIEMILAIFHLQVSTMLPIMFQVNGPFSSGEEANNRFSRWLPSWISDQKDFSFFFIYKSLRCFLLSLESIGLGV